MNAISTIQKIIQSRCNELNITYKELVIKTRYSNVSVGLKRLNQLFNNDYQASAGLIEKLSLALNLSVAEINQAIICSKLEQKAEQDEIDRLWFRPNVLVRTDKEVDLSKFSLPPFSMQTNISLMTFQLIYMFLSTNVMR